MFVCVFFRGVLVVFIGVLFAWWLFYQASLKKTAKFAARAQHVFRLFPPYLLGDGLIKVWFCINSFFCFSYDAVSVHDACPLSMRGCPPLERGDNLLAAAVRQWSTCDTHT